MECGLDFGWREVLGDGVVPPLWYVERRRTRGAFLRQALATLLAAIVRPCRLWSDVRMAHPVEGRRLVAFVALWPVIAFGMVSLATAAGVSLPLLQSRLVPLDEVARATAYLALPGAAAHGRVTVTRETVAPDGSVMSFAPAVVTAPVHARQASAFLLLAALSEAMLVAGFLIVYAAMPVTRRRCKVRARHLFRVAAISVASAVPLLLLPGFYAMALTAIAPTTTRAWTYAMQAIEIVVIGAGLIALLHPAVFWWTATRWYLRMPHAAGIAFAAWITALMMVMLVPAYVVGF